MEVQRLKSAKEGLTGLFGVLYMFTGFPCALLISLISVFMTPSLIREGAYSTVFFFAIIWLAAIVPVALIFSRARRGRKLTNSIVSSVRSKSVFWPDQADELHSPAAGKYFGIDTKNGTFLYINRIRKGQVDVVGLTMGDWTSRELEGSKLRLYTKFPEMPCIEISTPWAKRWYDTLGAMEYKRFHSTKPFSQYVSEHFEALERENNIHIPKLA